MIPIVVLAGMQMASSIPETRGPCLDSAKSVPMNLVPDNSATSDVVRIDILRLADADRSIVGFVYTLQRGDVWFGSRKSANMTEHGVSRIRRWLRTSAKPEGLRGEPFDLRDNGAVSYELKPDWRPTLPGERLRTSGCVSWPKHEPLPSQPPPRRQS